MNYQLIINPFAEEDLKDSSQWYEEQKDDLGEEFINEVKKIIFRILENPEQFPKHNKYIRKAVINRFPFSIFYYEKDFIITVFAIFHQGRNPKLLKSRTKK